MTNYRLQDGLSFCLVDGHAVFLDIRNDRYFRLSGQMERMFMAYVEGSHGLPDLAPLIERNILTASPPPSYIAQDLVDAAQSSALELPASPLPCGIGTATEVFTTVCWTQIRLKTRRLKAILDKTVDFRCRTLAPERNLEPALLNSTRVFLKARKLVPIENCCLLDSLSLASFLTKRRLYVNIVFGVTSDPFSAHCWVQSGNIVLNDTVGHTRTYTVIRVI